jgi:hypothetical protein
MKSANNRLEYKFSCVFVTLCSSFFENKNANLSRVKYKNTKRSTVKISRPFNMKTIFYVTHTPCVPGSPTTNDRREHLHLLQWP